MRIENDFFRVEIDSRSGCLRQVRDKAAGLDLIAEPRLSEPFRLLVPLPDLADNYIFGREQSPPAIARTGNSLELRWDGPLRNNCGDFDIGVVSRIELEEQAVRFSITVENNSDHTVTEVWHGFLGGITGLGDRADTRSMIPYRAGSFPFNVFEKFPAPSVGATIGMRFPEFCRAYPSILSMPWMDIFNERLGRGVYLGCHEKEMRAHYLRMELQPGVVRNRVGSNWPSPAEYGAMAATYPLGLVVNWVNMPYTAPGGVFNSPTVVLQSHEGDWHAGARIYRKWFASHFALPVPRRSWLRSAQAVQDGALLLPEGTLKFGISEIPQWAADARRYGVDAVLVSGWSAGGHDHFIPDYSPDPRLGTWDDLAQAVEACHEMDMKVYFFANIQPVACTTEWYRKELHKYRLRPAASHEELNFYGWGYGTLSGRLGITMTPQVKCDPSHPEFRRILVGQMRRIAEIGADGVHLDKVYPGDNMSFRPDHPDHPDQIYLQGILQCLQEMRDACREINPEFCIGVESYWDRTLSYADGWWNWHDGLNHDAALKYTFPEYMPTFTAVHPWDFNDVNNAIRYGYQLLVGPVRFSGSMADEQMRELAEYIREVLRIREQLKDAIFFGEYLDTLEVTVETPENVRFGAFRSTATGQRACVVVNQGQETCVATVDFHGSGLGAGRVYQPFAPARATSLPTALEIPGERLAIVLEEAGR